MLSTGIDMRDLDEVILDRSSIFAGCSCKDTCEHERCSCGSHSDANIECNRFCPCAASCSRRTVQSGLSIPLEVHLC
eukprot:m.352500 g.352500  ORF g.352500 m.352500 type:complete len:77 (-) comp55911_c0_seq30:1847-2077(-)